jgi:hypothetical protein
MVAGLPISTGSRDHSSGPPLHVVVTNHPHPRGYPSSDTNFEGPKGISQPKWQNVGSKEFAITVMKSIHQAINVMNKSFFQIDVSTSTSYEDIPSDEAPDPEDTQPIVHILDPVATPVELEEPIISLHALTVFLPHKH